jgi:trk system potassium uptake protein TrkA
MPKFAVIGLGQFGAHLVEALTAAGAEVIALDREAERIEEIRDVATLAIRLDATDEQALRAQGVHEVDAAIVGAGFEDTALATAALKSLGVPRVIARATSRVRGKILRSIGADEIIDPEGESATRLAQRLALPQIQDFLELGEGYSLIQITAPGSFHHKTPLELKLRQDYAVTLVAIRRREHMKTADADPEQIVEKIIVPAADSAILPEDTLIIVGNNEALATLPGQ